MGTLNYSDYRAMLGQHNLGSLRLNEGGDALELVNNHKYAIWKNGVVIDPDQNQRVRQDFYRSIEAYVASSGFATGEGRVQAFLEAVKRDLTGEGSGKSDLTRSDDLARIIDKVDTAILSGDFSIEQPVAEPNAQAPNQPVEDKPLSRRFVMVANNVDMEPGRVDAEKGGRHVNFQDHTLATIRAQLNPAKGHNRTLVNYLADRLGISKAQVSTYLKTRPESLMTLAKKTLESERFQMQMAQDKELYKTAAANGRLAQALISAAMQEIHGEKLSDCAMRDMKGTEKEVCGILSGLQNVPVRELLQNKEFIPFMKALNAISDPTTSGRFAFTLLGCKASVGRTPDGTAYCRMGNAGFKLRSQDMAYLKSTLVNQLSVEEGLEIEDLRELYSDDFLGSEAFGEFKPTISKAVISAHTGLSSLRLQSLSDKEMEGFADQILSGTTPEDVMKKTIVDGCTRMYSPGTINMIQEFESSPELQSTVSFKNPGVKPSGLKGLVADMFLNADVWKMDSAADIGAKLVESLADNLTALKELKTGDLDELVKTLPSVGDQKETLKALLQNLKETVKEANLDDKEAFKEFCSGRKDVFSEMAATLDTISQAGIEHFKDVFSRLIDEGLEVKEDKRPVKEKSLEELSQEQRNGTKSPEAKFMRTLLKEYLANTEPKVNHAMMASLFRAEGGAELDEAHQLGALFKGAGPIFQKFLQGIPAGALPEKMRAVVADMKTNLAPIPEKVVLAQLAQVVKESNGAIKSISVDKTLGSASVGQAFLCTLTDGEGKTSQCVIKMLKPDVQNNYSREIDIINRLADEVDRNSDTPGSMKATLQARLDSIQTELDLTVEGKHVEDGQVYNGESDLKAKARDADLVVGMKLVDGIKTKANIIALELAEGETLDKSINAANALLEEFSANATSRRLANQLYLWKKDGASCLEMKQKLIETSKTLAQKQKLMVACAQKWFNEAVYGSGFVHGDVHAGNVVLADKGDKITVIDYGNAFTLKKSEQESLQKMTAFATAGNVDGFLKSLFKEITTDPQLRKTEMTEAKVRADKQLMSDLQDVFAKGDDSAVIDRMTIAIGMLRQNGVAVPGAIFNFLEGMQRVKNAITDVTDACDEINARIGCLVPDDAYYYNADEGHLTEEGRKIMYGWADHLLPLGKMVSSASTYNPASDLFKSMNSASYDRFCKGEKTLDELVDAAIKKACGGEDVTPEEIETRLKISLDVVSGFMRDANEKAALETKFNDWKSNKSDESLKTLVRSLISAQQAPMKEFYSVPEAEELKSFGEAVGKVVADSMTDADGNMGLMAGMRLLGTYGFETSFRVLYSQDSKNGYYKIQSAKSKSLKFFDAKEGYNVRVLQGSGIRHCRLNTVDKMELSSLRKRGANMLFSAKVVNSLYDSVTAKWSTFELKDRDEKDPAPITDEEVMTAFVDELGDNMARFLIEDMLAEKDFSSMSRQSFEKNEKENRQAAMGVFKSAAFNEDAPNLSLTRYLVPLVCRGEIQLNNFFGGLRKNAAFDKLVTKDKIKTLAEKLQKKYLTKEMVTKLRDKLRDSYERTYGEKAFPQNGKMTDEEIKQMITATFEGQLPIILKCSFNYISSGLVGTQSKADEDYWS